MTSCAYLGPFRSTPVVRQPTTTDIRYLGPFRAEAVVRLEPCASKEVRQASFRYRGPFRCEAVVTQTETSTDALEAVAKADSDYLNWLRGDSTVRVACAPRSVCAQTRARAPPASPATRAHALRVRVRLLVRRRRRIFAAAGRRWPRRSST